MGPFETGLWVDGREFEVTFPSMLYVWNVAGAARGGEKESPRAISDAHTMLTLAASVFASIRSPPTIVSGLASIASRYDAIFLDQFGVMHDGQRPLPGAVECYSALAALDKALVVLSNTSRRRGFAIKKIPKLGFDETSLTGFITSGEAAWDHMAECHRGQKMLWLSWADDFQAWDPTYLDGLEVTLADAETADFVLLQGSHCIRTGSDGPPASSGIFATGEPSAELIANLRTCAARGLKLVVANPDFTVTLPDGTRGYMPGCIAQLYEDILESMPPTTPCTPAGSLVYFGKPYPSAFEAALQLLGPGVDPSRVLHVGDSLLHDVAGANAAGIHSLFVAGGIHADELGVAETGACAVQPAAESDGTGPLTAEALERLFAKTGVTPTMTVEAFVW